MYLIWLATDMCVLLCAHVTVMTLTTRVPWLHYDSGATKGKKHAEKVALRRYLPDIKLKIMLNDYEFLFSIFI